MRAFQQWLACLTAGFTAAALAPVRAGDQPQALPETYVDEAPLPDGFPPPSPLGQVVEKSYPVIRSFSAEGTNAFMKCFNYLAQQKHEMTAPVVMELPSDGEAGASSRGGTRVPFKRMHFLLERLSLDEPKQVGPVTVSDFPELRVLSIAHQGRLTDEAFATAKARLGKALAERPQLVAAGELRVLGYNGPSVSPDKTYWEIQLPVSEEAPTPNNAP